MNILTQRIFFPRFSTNLSWDCLIDKSFAAKVIFLDFIGFEHVFMGERTEKRIVGGHHSWVIFYLEEKGGEINYNGYKRHDGDLSGVIQYTWLHNLKHVGGFNIGTSPG
ncbi:Poly(U)-specific endoribonuclease-B, partial [Toxocara canis]